MIFGVLLDSNEEEKKKLHHQLGKLTALYTDEKLEIQAFGRSNPLMERLEGLDLLDLAIIDVTLPGALEGARKIREKFREAEILIIADITISPMKYMHPSIRASALLLHPAASEWEAALGDFFGRLLEKGGKEGQDGVLWVENRDGKFRIPYGQIYYLEARGKKVFIRTKAEEFGVRGTIENLAEQLPENFTRCQRSYIVNTDYITRVRLCENRLYLRDDLWVPISRSYREAFKRRIHE
ncbi:MAG: LytTR family transcriptional regulator DNA-binding domain-containing protein [Lachnospiraceae bacterium]|nr:LytTR family transcriptional regulator DNA-binding domain-containing protein [Lachnospiraceae bacterium]